MTDEDDGALLRIYASACRLRANANVFSHNESNMPSSAGSYDFFLCHAGGDKAIVEGYANRLQRLRASTAFDKYDIKPGQDWIERILDLLPSSKICVVFVSQHSSSAIVQGKEAFLARYLARQFPPAIRSFRSISGARLRKPISTDFRPRRDSGRTARVRMTSHRTLWQSCDEWATWPTRRPALWG